MKTRLLLSSVGLASALAAIPVRGATTDVTGTLNVDFGGVRAGAAGAYAESGNDFALNGGTLAFSGRDYSGGTGGLTLQVYNQQNNRNARYEFSTVAGFTGLINTSTPETLGAPNAGMTNALGILDVASSNNAPFAAAGQTSTDNIMGFWRGQLNAGTYTISGNADDGLVVYVNGVRVIDKNNYGGFAGTAVVASNGNFTTTGGDEVLIGFYEGTGGAGFRLFENGATGTDPMDLLDFKSAQPQTNLAAEGGAPGGQNVALNASSTISARNTYGVTLNTLTLGTAGQTLTAGSQAGEGLVRFAATNATTAGTTTFNTVSDVAVGLFSDGGNLTTLTKTGAGALIFDNTAADGTMANTTLNIQQGRVIVQATAGAANNSNFQPIKGARVELNADGTALQLQATETSTVNIQSQFVNPIFVNANASIVGASHVGTRELNIGSGATGITIAAGKTLDMVATTGANLRLNGTVTGGSDTTLRVNTGMDAPNSMGFVFWNSPGAGFTGRVEVGGGGNLRIDNSTAITSASAIDVQNGGRLELNVTGGYTNALPITTAAGSFLRLQQAGVIGAGQTLNIYPGRTVEIQQGTGLTTGTVLRAPNATVSVNAGNGAAGTHHLTGSFAPSTFRSLDVLRLANNMNGVGGAGNLGATPAGTVLSANGDRRITQNASLTLNGQILTNDNNNRAILDNDTGGSAPQIDVGALGLTLAGGNGNYIQLFEKLSVTGTSGPITFGTHIPLEGVVRAGSVLLANTANSWAGTGTPASVVSGTVIEAVQQNNLTPSSGINADFAVNLDRGTLRAIPPTTGAATNHGGVSLVGKINVTGDGRLLATQRADTNTLIELRINSPLSRADDPGTTNANESRGTLLIRSENNRFQNTGGTAAQNQQIRFTTLADAPARMTASAGAGGGTINMVAPWMVSPQDNGRFVDYDPTQNATTGVGFTLAVKTDVADTAAFEGAANATAILKNTGAVTLTGPQTVGALIASGNVSGTATNNLTIESGGLIISGGGGTGVGRTISAPIVVPDGREFLVHATAAGFHAISGTISSTGGLTKWGPNTVQLSGNNAATLIGDIAINEASLVYSNDNHLGASTNKIIFNGGNLRPAANLTLGREMIANLGGAELVNDGDRLVQVTGTISGPGRLRFGAVTPTAAGANYDGVFTLAQTGANTFMSGLHIDQGIVEFSRDEQLGATPDANDYDRGHITINANQDGSTFDYNTTLRLASGSGTVTTTGRQFTIISSNSRAARIDVAGADDRLVIDNDIRGSGILHKNGPGTLELSNPDGNGYTGGTVVNAGKLVVNNTSFTGTGSGGVTVKSGATLGGSGVTEGAILVESGATLAPGNSPGKFTIGGVTTGYAPSSLSLAGSLDLEIDGTTAGTQHDQVSVFGAVSLGGTSVISLDLGFTPTPYHEFFVVLNDGNDPVTGTFSNAPGGIYTDALNNQWIVNTSANGDGGQTGNDISVTYVPEPGASTLLSAVLVQLLCLRRR